MRQILHLLIVSRGQRRALAARYGTRWLLPTIACGEMARAGLVAARWCAARGIAGDVAGQWLGRVETESIDWLMAIRAHDPLPAAERPFEWIDLDWLASGLAVLEYQWWALRRCLACSGTPSVDGPFGNLDWPEHARAWIAASTGSTARAWTPYRTSAYEVVAGVDTARGRVYFKGLSGEGVGQAFVTKNLAAVAPASFAPTLALEHRGHGMVRWLTGECPGRPSRDTVLVAAALARVQQQLISRSGGVPGLADLELETAALWACTRCGGRQEARVIHDACEYVQNAAFPHAWIPMDLDPTNVLVHRGHVRFIDVDDSFAGPAPLAIATFARRCRDRAAYAVYEGSWPALPGRVDWERVEIAAAVVVSWLGWERLKRNVERGEVFGALDRLETRVHRRLERDLYCR